MFASFIKSSCVLALLLGLSPAAAFSSQDPVDRTDPSVIREELRSAEDAVAQPKDKAAVERAQGSDAGLDATILVGAIRIEGATVLPPAAFAPVVNAYVGRLLTPEELQALASDVANVARQAGYGLATAWVPQQRIANGILRVTLDEGRIDAIEAEGAGASVVSRTLAPIANGKPVRTAELERRLLLAGDVAGVRVGKGKLVRKEGRNVLLIATTRDRTAGRISFDNWGTGTVGPVRAHLALDINGLASDDDRVTVGGVVTPLDPGEFHLVRASYNKAIGSNGTEVTVGGYYARSNPGGFLADFDYGGRSYEASIGLNHPFLRTRAASIWGDLQFAVRDAVQTREDSRIRRDRLSTLTASTYMIGKFGKSRARARFALTQGLDAFDATREGDPLASRDDGSAVFTKVEYWAQYTTPLAGPVSLQLESEGQLASRALLSSEEIGLGGRSFLRGYDYREFAGDHGIAGSAELQLDLRGLPKPVTFSQLYLYGDAGTVGNSGDGSGGGSLASAGGGVRLWLGTFEATLEVGVPLSDGDDDGADNDPRISFTVGKRF